MTCFKTMVGIIEESEVQKIAKVCYDTSIKDSTFVHKIVRPRNPELKAKFKAILIVNSDTEEMANKRGGWLIHKMKDAKVSNYFWVKTCKKK